MFEKIALNQGIYVCRHQFFTVIFVDELVYVIQKDLKVVVTHNYSHNQCQNHRSPRPTQTPTLSSPDPLRPPNPSKRLPRPSSSQVTRAPTTPLLPYVARGPKSSQFFPRTFPESLKNPPDLPEPRTPSPSSDNSCFPRSSRLPRPQVTQ